MRRKEDPSTSPGAAPNSEGFLPLLGGLDALLARAVAAVRSGAGAGAEGGAEEYRGLYVSGEEAARLLAGGAGAPLLGAETDAGREALAELASACPRLASLARAHGLSSFDLCVICVALAPELDTRYERVYAYLQDDVTRRRPAVDLALRLLCPSESARLARRAHFAPDAPLAGGGLLRLLPDPHQTHPPLLSHYLQLDRQVVAFLLGEDGMGARVAEFARLVEPAARLGDLPIPDDAKRALPLLAARARAAGEPLLLYFHGPAGAGKRAAAEALAGEACVPLVVLDVARALAADDGFGEALRAAFREARLRDAALHLEGVDALRADERAAQRGDLSDALGACAGIVVLSGEQPRAPRLGESKVLEVHLPAQDFGQRRACWSETLGRRGVAVDAVCLDALAGRFRLTRGEIDAACGAAEDLALWRSLSSEADADATTDSPAARPTPRELFAGARAQSARDLGSLARRIVPKYGWHDIVLPPDPLAQLEELCEQAKHRQVVYGEWGFGRKLSLGRGLAALFSGPPGTGKTMAAEVIADDLQLDLYKINLSQVVSKYIGETEKNLEQIFRAAQSSDAVLFFDEADALFGKRSEVRDAHDRYANIETGYLLQRMEEYDGVAILATNLRQNMDEAFVRRMQFVVEFPFPDEEYRRRIWDVTFPGETPLAADVDFDFLARSVRLAGGHIKNIGLAAAFYAASDGRVVRMPHLVRAARREFQKLGRSWSEKEWDAPQGAAVS